MSEADKIKWNRKYEERLKDASLPHPSPILKELTPLLHGKSALDLACGLGGNSVYLAKLGFHVTAWDISDVAISHLKDLSTKNKLTIKAEVKDLDALQKINASFDLVVDTFYLNRSLFPIMKEVVKPGGLCLMQTFFKIDLETSTHISDDYKLRPGELKEIFTGWDILLFDEAVATGLQSILACKKQ